MTKWIVALAATVAAAALALTTMSAYVLVAVDTCAPDTAAASDSTAAVADGALRARQLAVVAADAGFTGDDLALAVAVALAESGGRPTAVNTANSDGSSDHGLWQINSVHRASGFDPARAHDPAYNAAWAHRIFTEAGNRWTPWVAYTTGAHRRHLATARDATEVIGGQHDAPVAGGLDIATLCGQMAPDGFGRDAGDTGPITTDELAAIGKQLGQPVPSYSILRDRGAYGDGTGGPSVNLLAPQMQVAVAQLEIAMDARLQVTSGYRTADYQAQLCARPGIGRCAPPGRSMHQHGLAVDVVNWRQALPHLAGTRLCQPLPADDAVHLSHVDGTEC